MIYNSTSSTWRPRNLSRRSQDRLGNWSKSFSPPLASLIPKLCASIDHTSLRYQRSSPSPDFPKSRSLAFAVSKSPGIPRHSRLTLRLSMYACISLRRVSLSQAQQPPSSRQRLPLMMRSSSRSSSRLLSISCLVSSSCRSRSSRSFILLARSSAMRASSGRLALRSRVALTLASASASSALARARRRRASIWQRSVSALRSSRSSLQRSFASSRASSAAHFSCITPFQ